MSLKRHRDNNEIYNDIQNKIKNEWSKREISMNDICSIHMSIDEYLWFQHHIKLRDFIANNNCDYECGENYLKLVNTIYNKYNDIKNNKLDKFKTIDDKIIKEIKNRLITMKQVYELEKQLTIDDYVWFKKNIELRDKQIYNNEEDYDLVNVIYNKYLKVSNENYYKLEQLHIKYGVNNIVDDIVNSSFSEYEKLLLFKKYKFYCENNEMYSEEYMKCIHWIDTVLTIPTKCQTINGNITDILFNIHKYLNESIYGLNNVKEKIMELMCGNLLSKGMSDGKILCLIGPPGVGKTSIAHSISKALNMPFDDIAFGSITDPNMLVGHSFTYIGATPGLFTKSLIKSKQLNSVILLDEIDKIKETNILSILYHVLDKSQNNSFKDMYIPEIPLDLSKIIFICSGNDVNDLDPILKDRLCIVNISGYDINDKIKISKNFIIPKLLMELKFDNNEIIYDDSLLKYIIDKTEFQPGMRSIERKLRELYERLALLKYSKNINYSFLIKNIKFPLTLTTNIIDKLLV